MVRIGARRRKFAAVLKVSFHSIYSFALRTRYANGCWRAILLFVKSLNEEWCFMQEITQEWVEKAEGDFLTANRELQAQPPNFDAAAFHAQQCAEKYLKARLVVAGVGFPKTHDLGILLNLILPIEPAWEQLRLDLDALTSLGIEVRYPGTSADREDAEMALRTAATVRACVRIFFGASA